MPLHACVGEVLSAEHVVAPKFQMRPAEREHDGICHDDAGRVEVLAVRGVVHVGGKDGAKGRVEVEVLVDDVLDVREASVAARKTASGLIAPDFRVEEVHLSCPCNLLCAPLSYGVHDKPLVGVSVLHVVDERREAVAKVDAVAIIVIDSATSAELVNLVAVEVEEGIDLVVALSQIVEPTFVARVDDIDVALP